jgi:hypothetical protein
MQFAMSRDAVPADLPAEAQEPSAAKQRRVATTATLLAVALCAFMAQGHLLAARTPSHNAAVAAAQNAGTAPVTIVAPEFCKDQTWPYIDSRCLRRVDNPAPDASQAAVPPATAAAATPAPSGGSGTTVAATPTPAETPAEAPAASNAPPGAAAPDPTDTRAQIIQSVFPAAAPSATPDTSANPATDTYQRTSDVSQHHRSRHRNNQLGFFGLRF